MADRSAKSQRKWGRTSMVTNKNKYMKSELIESRFDRLLVKTMKIFAEANIGTFDATVSQYDLILESALDFVVDEVLFRVTHHNGSRYITEIRLHQEDVFVFDQ